MEDLARRAPEPKFLVWRAPLTRDDEANRLSARASRYARLGVNAGALAARVGVNRLRGGGRETDARALASLLGSMKGPMMKVAQLSCAAACRPSSGRAGASASPSSI
jgi:hypothetical protein